MIKRKRTLAQSEVPPLTPYITETYLKEKDAPGTLGEIVVTDPRDPFVWLATEITRPYDMPSTDGKHLLWLIYRMSGTLPQTDQGVKWRDNSEDIDSMLRNIRPVDSKIAERYIAHLIQLDAEEAGKNYSLKSQAPETVPEAPGMTIKLHEPNHELVSAAIMHHLEIIDELSKPQQ